MKTKEVLTAIALLALPALARAQEGPGAAHFAAPPPADPEARRVRELRGLKWNTGNPALRIPDDPGNSFKFVHRLRKPADWLPMESDAIVVGKILNAHSYLTPDRSSVYTEFSVQIQTVLKAPTSRPIGVGDTVITQREGGVILYPAGNRRETDRPHDAHRPRAGVNYVLFLNRDAASDTWRDELCLGVYGPTIRAVDWHGKRYDGMPKNTFLDVIRGLLGSAE